MPTNARRAFDARDLPSRARIACKSCADNEERCDANQKYSGYGGNLERKSKRGEAPARCGPLLRELIKRRGGLIVAIPPQQILQLLYFRVRLAGAVPQIIIFHGSVLLNS